MSVWPDFADSDLPLMLARMGRMWGKLPHELLALSPEDFGLNLVCLSAWDRHIADQIRRVKPMGVIDLGAV